MSRTSLSTPTPTRPPRRPLLTPLLAAACLLALAVGGLGSTTAQAAGGPDQVQQRAAQRLEARLRPSGDPDGSGQAHLRFAKNRGRVCATIEWQGIDQPDSAHIHRVSDGGVVVDLSGAVTGGARCTTAVSHRLIAQILRHPRRYYVNVHNPTYPAGAIQGTLRR